MNTLEFSSIYDDGISEQELESFLEKNSSGFNLHIHYSYIGVTQHYVDVMYDHLEMSFCIEAILQFATLLNYEISYRYKGGVSLLIRPDQLRQLALTLLKICILKTEVKEPDEDEVFSLREEVEDYRDEMDRIIPKFPQAIDEYYANWVNGGIWEITGEYLYDNGEDETSGEDIEESGHESEGENIETDKNIIEEQDASDVGEKTLSDYYSDNPEWKWGVWQSAAGRTMNELFYVSTYCWIVPKNSDYNKILTYYSGFKKEIHFEPAVVFNYNEKSIAINDFGGIRVDNLLSFQAAIQCSKIALTDKPDYSSYDIPIKDFKIYISEFRDVLMLEDEDFRFIYFDFNSIGHEELKMMWEQLSPSVDHIQNLLGVAAKLTFDWSLLDDDQFENLCYDILCIHTKFDASTIRKMGKSKSRDGGRDIVIYTNSVVDLSEKYIFQCKLVKGKASLTKSKLQGAANTIIEHEAQGYGVFTSTVIDSTLYDMLDGFSRNKRMKIKTDINFSVYELEKFLNRNLGLMNKYFPVN